MFHILHETIVNVDGYITRPLEKCQKGHNIIE
jgi:hypothetical protein